MFLIPGFGHGLCGYQLVQYLCAPTEIWTLMCNYKYL